jgi:hypothetical protein
MENELDEEEEKLYFVERSVFSTELDPPENWEV